MSVGRLLVTGGRGQLGRHLSLAYPGEALAPGRAELDITRPESIAAQLDRHAPAVVVNAAAYTDVDGAETDVEGAHRINVEGARLLAEACRDRGIRLVHLSTDYVFSGEVPGVANPGADPAPATATATGPAPATAPELEPTDATAPATVYGRTKLAGEHAVSRAHPEATIIRTAWLYTGPDRERLQIPGSDFVATMARLERERDTVTVVDDQWGSPTYAPALASAIADMLAREVAGDADPRGLTLHAAGAGRATWFEVARRAFEYLGADPDRVRPCTTADFPRPAPRPAFSVLSGRAWAAAGLAPLPDWDVSLRAALDPGPGTRDAASSSSSST